MDGHWSGHLLHLRMPPFKIAEADGPNHAGLRFGRRHSLVLVLDFLILGFGIRILKTDTMGFSGEHTPPACGFRRRAENLVRQTFSTGNFRNGV
jgi:hypothetical protein